MAQTYDILFKYLIQTSSTEFLRLLGIQEPVTPLPNELTADVIRRADFLGSVPNGTIIHVEFESSPDKRILWRMLEYFVLIARACSTEDGKPYLNEIPNVQQIVLTCGRRPVNIKSILHQPDLHFRFRVIDIDNLDVSEFIWSDQVRLVLLGILCNRRADNQEWRRLLTLLRSPKLNDYERLIYVSYASALSTIRTIDQDIDTELHEMGIEINIDDSPLFREMKARIIKKENLDFLQEALSIHNIVIDDADRELLLYKEKHELREATRRLYQGAPWADVALSLGIPQGPGIAI